MDIKQSYALDYFPLEYTLYSTSYAKLEGSFYLNFGIIGRIM
jgi:hypothetical protein